jgi:MFS family permease
MFAPGVPDLMKEFHSTSEELASFCVSVYVLGFAAGPMFFAPLSEVYGRSIIYQITNVGFIGKILHSSRSTYYLRIPSESMMF